MTRRWAFDPALTLFLFHTLQAQTASLQGTVIDAQTKQPLPAAHVSVNPQTPGPHYGAIATATGRFSIANLPPGAYTIHSDRTGYLFTEGTIAITLKPGDNKTDLLIALTPRAFIRGRVTDESGDPVPGTVIHAIPESQGKTLLEIPAFGGVTDDRGEYRISGPPGKYYISAEHTNTDIYTSPHEIRTDGSQPALYVATWFPAFDSKAHATPVEAAAARETSGIDIRLISKHAVSVSGLVSGRPEGKQPALVRVWSAASAPDFEIARTMRTTGTSPDNTFTLLGLTSGDYMMEAEYFGAVTLRSPPVPVHLGNSETTGIQLALAPGEELTGKIEIPAAPDGEKRTITLNPTSAVHRAAGQSSTAAVGPDGSFHMPDIFPGQYTVAVDPLPENGYIADNNLDLTSGIGSRKARIEIRLDGATLSGSIVDADGHPATAPRLLVILERTPGDAERRVVSTVQAPDQFLFNGIRPGKYRFYAVNGTALLAAPEVLRNLFERAEEIELHGGDRIVKNAKIFSPR